MAATIHSLISEAKRNKLSLIGPLTEDDVHRVWEKVAQSVETLMSQQKGLSISGLGTFTFSKRSIDVGNNKAILIQRPVFVLSERFIQTHSLHCVKKHTSGQIPLHTLNLTQLSNETGLSRELVEGAIREILQTLSRAVAAKKSIEFDLKDIGRLTIHDCKAKMSFFREFIYRLDVCDDMEGVFRMSTAGSNSICSIMSNPPSRPSTTLTLPSIIQSTQYDGDNMVDLSLGCSGDTPVDTSLSPPAGDTNSSSSSYDSTRLSRQLEKESHRMSTISEEEEEEEDCVANDKSRVEKCKEGVCTVDENGKLSSKISSLANASTDTSNQLYHKSPRVNLIPKPAVLIVGSGERSRSRTSSHPPPPHSGRQSSQSRSHSRSQREQGTQCRSNTTSGSVKSGHTTTTGGSCSCSKYSSVSRPSTCSHQSSTGQELCYLCHQRALRNVPIDLSKERAAQEKWHNETLQEYQRRHELLSMARTQANKTKHRLINHEIATFNQTMSDNIKKQKEVKSTQMDPSYVFCDRSVTPAPYHSQMKYCGELDSQVVMKHTRRYIEREEEEKTGREEQERLAKDLAAYEELYRKMKAQSMEDYKAALNEQTCLKPIETTTTCTTDQPSTQRPSQLPVFGIHKGYNEKERAKGFFLDQLAMVDEKQKRVKEKALRCLKDDADRLKSTKEGLKADLWKEKNRRVQARQALEGEWFASMRGKQKGLLEDLQRAKEQGIRLHQQCERYQRCKQCQRKRHNVGKSNILHETRYTSGSRLMV